jgi:hypothetical protein
VQQLKSGGLVNEIEKIISRLEQQKASIEKAIIALHEVSGLAVEESKTTVSEPSKVEKPKRYISPEGRERIAEASRKRWAAKRAAEKAAANASKPAKKKASPAKKKSA